MAVTAATALVASLTTPSVATQEHPSATADTQRAEHTHRAGAARVWVTLITGDRVSVDAKGHPPRPSGRPRVASTSPYRWSVAARGRT
ncbi:hypothetical protein [Streptomyces sp. NPDC057676]|uniref:hypothetical protein n=1 Tax=Streptomyces sp. NPDC057676 TaxID=3346205 RepID=UPI0036CA9961